MKERLRRRRIAIVTDSRAEYGILFPVMRHIHSDPRLKLLHIVTGAHLEPAFGLTVREVEADGLPIAARVPLGSGGGTTAQTVAQLSRAVDGIAKAFARLSPDIVVLLGDRFEMLAAASSALVMRLPIAHLHGGESTEGAWDESIRHAITKMSHLHFPSHPVYARRIRQMGEEPSRIFCFGSPLIDRVSSFRRWTREELARDLRIALDGLVGIVTFHPETLRKDGGMQSLDALLQEIAARPGSWIFTAANADTFGSRINQRLKRFVQSRKDSILVPNLGQARYFSLLRYANLMAGNSSSGILDAPYFGLPVVNIGDRQKGRLRLGNVLEVPTPSKRAIGKAIDQALAMPRPRPLSVASSPSRKIVHVLRTIRLGEPLLKKRFSAQ